MKIDSPPLSVELLARRAFHNIARALHFHSPVEELFASGRLAKNKATERIGAAVANKERWKSSLRTYYSLHRDQANIDYHDPLLFSSFDALYFFRNLFKSCYTSAFWQLNYPQMGRLFQVADLGCGSGVFGIAWYQVFKILNESSAGEFSVIFLDREAFQLKLAGALAQITAIPKFVLIQDDFFNVNVPPALLRVGDAREK